MDCWNYREALSARLDHEEEQLDAGSVDQHLASCATCRVWWEHNSRLLPTMRLTEAPRVPDLSEKILAATTPPRRERRDRRERWGMRAALAVVALLQAGLGLAQLLGASTGHAGHMGVSASHLSNESAAWNLAVGIGLLWAASRPNSAGGLLPALTGFIAVLGAVSAADLFGGGVTVGRVLSHGIILVGVGLLFLVHRQHRLTSGPAPAAATNAPDEHPSRDGFAQLNGSQPHARAARRPFAHRDVA